MMVKPEVKEVAKEQLRHRPKKTGQTKVTKGFLLGIIALFFACGLAIVAQATIFIESSYRLSQIKKEIRAIEQENARLRLARDELRSPERIERLASSKLNMRRPNPEEVMVVRVPAPSQVTVAAEKREKDSVLLAARKVVSQIIPAREE